jgi:hypothetical protein
MDQSISLSKNMIKINCEGDVTWKMGREGEPQIYSLGNLRSFQRRRPTPVFVSRPTRDATSNFLHLHPSFHNYS